MNTESNPVSHEPQLGTEPVRTRRRRRSRRTGVSKSSRRWTSLFLAVLAVLTIGTWALGNASFRHSGGGDIAFNGHFPGDSEGWVVTGNIEVGEYHLTMRPEADDESRARWKVRLPPRSTSNTRVAGVLNTVFGGERLLQVRYLVETLESPGSLPSGGYPAMIATWLIDRDKSLNPFRYLPSVLLIGQARSVRGTAYVSMPDETDEIELVFSSFQSTGSFRMSHLEARIVRETTLYRILLVMGMLAWTGFAAMLAFGVVRRAGYKIGVLIGVSMAAIVIGVLLPESIRPDPLRRVIGFIGGLANQTSEPDSFIFAFKLGHFVFFAVATAVGLYFRRHLSVRRWQVLAFFVMMALATEGMQLHLLGRSTRFMDLVIDVAGILLAAGLFSLWTRWRRAQSTVNRE